jgi:hypothetical protein
MTRVGSQRQKQIPCLVEQEQRFDEKILIPSSVKKGSTFLPPPATICTLWRPKTRRCNV